MNKRNTCYDQLKIWLDFFADRNEGIWMKSLSFRTLPFERNNWRYAIVVLRSHFVGCKIIEMKAAPPHKTLKESMWRMGRTDSQIIHLDCYYYKSTWGFLVWWQPVFKVHVVFFFLVIFFIVFVYLSQTMLIERWSSSLYLGYLG